MPEEEKKIKVKNGTSLNNVNKDSDKDFTNYIVKSLDIKDINDKNNLKFLILKKV